jgi:enamine deaminase RidA (YjgF/YER057c/UK114 family)
MTYLVKKFLDLNVVAEIAVFEPVDKVHEFQVMVHVDAAMMTFQEQLDALQVSLHSLLADDVLRDAVPVFAHCFMSDVANQQEEVSLILSKQLNCTVSCVKQPPLDGSKLALWLQLQTGVKAENDGLIFFEHNGYRQYFTTADCGERTTEKCNSYFQTKELLENYQEQLSERGCTLARDCVRTWFFVRDVDLNYQGVVDARRENFELNGLTNKTHYIASTGIEGCVSNPNVKVILNTHLIKGLDDGQIQFLYAKENLNPTYEYGVTFERGVFIDFGDRRKVYISGTASIDNKGLIVHPGDIEKQVYRMWENVTALLDEADCAFDDLMQIIVYLRDMADYKLVNKLFDQKFPTVPKVIVLAPICRPGWLVEMECIASKTLCNTQYRDL